MVRNLQTRLTLTPMLRWGLKIWCSKLKTVFYLSNIVVFMQLPMPTQQLQPAQLHPLGPQNQPSQLEHNPPSGEPSQPEYDARPIPHPLGSPFHHSSQARVDLSKVKLRGISAQSSRRRRGLQTPPRQPEDSRNADSVSGYISKSIS